MHCNVTAPRVYIMHSVHRLPAYILCTQCTGSLRIYYALNAPAPRVHIMHSMHRLPEYILCTQCNGSPRTYYALNAPAPRVYVMHSMHRLLEYILCTQCESCIARAKQDRILQRMQTEEFGHVFGLTHYTLHMQSPPTFFKESST